MTTANREWVIDAASRARIGRVPGFIELATDGNVGKQRCWCYHVIDVDDRLLYVGIAENFPFRWRQHLAKSWWVKEVLVSAIVVFGYQTREGARQAEAWAINEQYPVYNTSPESAAYERYVRARASHRHEEAIAVGAYVRIDSS